MQSWVYPIEKKQLPMFRKLSFLLLWVIGPIFLEAQTTVDSLNSWLSDQTFSDDTYRVVLTQLAKKYAETNPDTALDLATKSLKLVVEGDSLSGQGFVAMSTAYSYLARYDSSTFYAFKALEIGESYHDKVTMIDALNNLGIDYLFQEDYQQSLDYFGRMKNLSQEIGDTLRWGHALNNIGMIHGYENRLDKELDHYDQAAGLFLAIGERDGYANTLLNAGTTYTLLEQYGEADRLYEEALKIFEQLGYSSGIQQTLQSAAESKLMQGKYEEAAILANEALVIIREYDYAQDEIYCYELLTQIAEAHGDYREALNYQRLMSEKKEEVFNLERINQIDELQTRYETEKKEQELALNQLKLIQIRNEKLVLIGIIVLIIVGGVYVFLSMRKQAMLEKKLLIEEVDNLRLKINSLLGTGEGVKISIEEINTKLVQPLSEREFDILELTISDKSNNEIAETLFVSVNTVKFHLKNIYEKLGVSNRKEAISFVISEN
jgi:DNA-binding CsgD family transcriptional regulator